MCPQAGRLAGTLTPLLASIRPRTRGRACDPPTRSPMTVRLTDELKDDAAVSRRLAPHAFQDRQN